MIVDTVGPPPRGIRIRASTVDRQTVIVESTQLMHRSVVFLATTLALLAIGSIGVYWGLLYFAQPRLIYPRPSVIGLPLRPVDAEAAWLKTAAGRVEAWYLAPRAGIGSPAPLVLFTHGNGEVIDMWPAAFELPRLWGCGVLLLEYPGYGRSTGEPSEASITDAALAAYDWAAARGDIDTRRIVAYGRSLGGGAACAIAAKRPIAALILESSFSSLRPFARRYHAPSFLLRDVFDNIAALRGYRSPLLVLHGANDAVIPPENARELAAAVQGAEIEILPCGHNDCPRPWDRIRRFLAKHGVLSGHM